MRDINRIDEVLEEIKKVWKENPDLRLGQLLLNIADETTLYYIEDNKLVEKIKNFYNLH